MTIRRLARQFAIEALEQQKKDFQSWAILADWKNSYKTFDKNFIADQLKLFWKLYKKVRDRSAPEGHPSIGHFNRTTTISVISSLIKIDNVRLERRLTNDDSLIRC